MSRKLKLLSEKLEKMLIDQLAHELKNYNLYKSFANYYDIEGVVDLEHAGKMAPHDSGEGKSMERPGILLE